MNEVDAIKSTVHVNLARFDQKIGPVIDNIGAKLIRTSILFFVDLHKALNKMKFKLN